MIADPKCGPCQRGQHAACDVGPYMNCRCRCRVTENQQRADELWAALNIAGLDGEMPNAAATARVASAYRTALDAAEARGRAEVVVAWAQGYATGCRDTELQPYSDRPERATWRPTANPYHADALEEMP